MKIMCETKKCCLIKSLRIKVFSRHFHAKLTHHALNPPNHCIRPRQVYNEQRRLQTKHATHPRCSRAHSCAPGSKIKDKHFPGLKCENTISRRQRLSFVQVKHLKLLPNAMDAAKAAAFCLQPSLVFVFFI